MRTIRLDITFPRSTQGTETIRFNVDDDATEEQIRAECEDFFFNECNYGWEELDPEDAV